LSTKLIEIAEDSARGGFALSLVVPSILAGLFLAYQSGINIERTKQINLGYIK